MAGKYRLVILAIVYYTFIRPTNGVWRSPVARLHGVQEASSSNLDTPTHTKKGLSQQIGLFIFYGVVALF